MKKLFNDLKDKINICIILDNERDTIILDNQKIEDKFIETKKELLSKNKVLNNKEKYLFEFQLLNMECISILKQNSNLITFEEKFIKNIIQIQGLVDDISLKLEKLLDKRKENNLSSLIKLDSSNNIKLLNFENEYKKIEIELIKLEKEEKEIYEKYKDDIKMYTTYKDELNKFRAKSGISNKNWEYNEAMADGYERQIEYLNEKCMREYITIKEKVVEKRKLFDFYRDNIKLIETNIKKEIVNNLMKELQVDFKKLNTLPVVCSSVFSISTKNEIYVYNRFYKSQLSYVEYYNSVENFKKNDVLITKKYTEDGIIEYFSYSSRVSPNIIEIEYLNNYTGFKEIIELDNGKIKKIKYVNRDKEIMIDVEYKDKKVEYKNKNRTYVPSGLWHEYKNGKLYKEKEYNDGLLLTTRNFYYDTSSKLLYREEKYFKDDNKENMIFKINYNKEGKIISEISEFNGSTSFKQKIFSDKGILQKEERVIRLSLDGLAKYYYEDGQLKEEGYYNSGKKHGIWKKYSKNGQLIEEANYKHDYLDGIVKVYYENGQIKEEVTYKGGHEDGQAKYYYENGQLSEVGDYYFYVELYKEGVWKSYSPEGELTFMWDYGRKKRYDDEW